MRTNVEINDNLMDEVLRLGKIRTKREAIDQALQHFVRLLKQQGMLNLKGKIKWDGDLDDMRISKKA